MLAAMTAQAQILSGPDSLSTYIAAALRNNPGILSEFHAYQAQVDRACGAGQLNDPQVNIGFFPQPMQHANVKQNATVSVMQMFPWFGTLRAGRHQMQHEAEAAYQKFREKAIALTFDVEKLWYQMLATKEKIKAVVRKQSLTDNIMKITVDQYKNFTVGRGNKMSDQLRLEAELKRLTQQQESLQAQLLLQEQSFNLLLHRPANASLVIPDTVVMNTLPVLDWSEVERNNPKLIQLQAERKAFEAQDEKARNMGKPMIGVGLQYMLNSKVDKPQMANMNGNDMVMPMVSFTLPIYRKKTNAARRSARRMMQSAEQGYLNTQDRLRANYLDMLQRADDVQRELKLYDEETALLNQTLQLMLKEYAAGTTSLTDLLQLLRDGIDYTLKQAEARARYNIIVAEVMQLAANDQNLMLNENK